MYLAAIAKISWRRHSHWSFLVTFVPSKKVNGSGSFLFTGKLFPSGNVGSLHAPVEPPPAAPVLPAVPVDAPAVPVAAPAAPTVAPPVLGPAPAVALGRPAEPAAPVLLWPAVPPSPLSLALQATNEEMDRKEKTEAARSLVRLVMGHTRGWKSLGTIGMKRRVTARPGRYHAPPRRDQFSIAGVDITTQGSVRILQLGHFLRITLER